MHVPGVRQRFGHSLPDGHSRHARARRSRFARVAGRRTQPCNHSARTRSLSLRPFCSHPQLVAHRTRRPLAFAPASAPQPLVPFFQPFASTKRNDRSPAPLAIEMRHVLLSKTCWVGTGAGPRSAARKLSAPARAPSAGPAKAKQGRPQRGEPLQPAKTLDKSRRPTPSLRFRALPQGGAFAHGRPLGARKVPSGNGLEEAHAAKRQCPAAGIRRPAAPGIRQRPAAPNRSRRKQSSCGGKGGCQTWT